VQRLAIPSKLSCRQPPRCYFVRYYPVFAACRQHPTTRSSSGIWLAVVNWGLWLVTPLFAAIRQEGQVLPLECDWALSYRLKNPLLDGMDRQSKTKLFWKCRQLLDSREIRGAPGGDSNSRPSCFLPEGQRRRAILLTLCGSMRWRARGHDFRTSEGIRVKRTTG